MKKQSVHWGHLQTSPRGKLKVTAPTTFGENKVVPLLNDFIAQYPELEVECRLTNQKVDLVDAGFDLAIRWAGWRIPA